MPIVNIKKIDERAIVPTYASEAAAGADLYAVCDEPIEVLPHTTQIIHTGLCIEVPQGFAGLVYARSGIATREGLAPANKVGVIDADYRGEIMVSIHNHSEATAQITNGERIAQLVITPFLKADFALSEQLSDTVRGENGFGSTGKS